MRLTVTLLPLVTGPCISFLKPSQLPGEYTACATRLNQSQEPPLPSQVPILPLGEEKQLQLSVLLKDTSVMTGIRTYTPMT